MNTIRLNLEKQITEKDVPTNSYVEFMQYILMMMMFTLGMRAFVLFAIKKVLSHRSFSKETENEKQRKWKRKKNNASCNDVIVKMCTCYTSTQIDTNSIIIIRFMDLYQMVFSHNLLGRFALYIIRSAHCVWVCVYPDRMYPEYTVIKDMYILYIRQQHAVLYIKFTVIAQNFWCSRVFGVFSVSFGFSNFSVVYEFRIIQ